MRWRSIARPASRRRATPSISSTSANTCTSSSGRPRPWPPGARSRTGPTGTPRTWAGWREVLAGFGYLKEAVGPLSEAVQLEKEDFDLRLKLAELSHRLEKFDDAEAQLAAAARLAEKDEQKTAVLESRVKNDQAADRLAAGIEAHAQGAGGRPGRRRPSVGRHWPATSRPTASCPRRSTPPTGPSRSTRARSRPGRWRPGSASRPATWPMPPTPSVASPRSTARTGPSTSRRSPSWRSRLGRVEAALKAGRDLIAAAPGNPEQLRVLRPVVLPARSVRGGARRTPTRRAGQPERHQDRPHPGRDPRRTVPHRRGDRDVLAGLRQGRRARRQARGRQQADRAVLAAQPVRPPPDPAPAPGARRRAGAGAGQTQQRDVAICTAQAYATSGDLGAARAELEPLLAANTRDTQLLQQLSKLAEEEGDIEDAAALSEAAQRAGPQRRAARPGSRSSTPATATWRKPRRSGRRWPPARASAHRIFQAIDSLLGNRKPQPVARDHRGDGPQGPARLGGPLSAGRGPGGARKARGGRASVPGPARR